MKIRMIFWLPGRFWALRGHRSPPPHLLLHPALVWAFSALSSAVPGVAWFSVAAAGGAVAVRGGDGFLPSALWQGRAPASRRLRRGGAAVSGRVCVVCLRPPDVYHHSGAACSRGLRIAGVRRSHPQARGAVRGAVRRPADGLAACFGAAPCPPPCASGFWRWRFCWRGCPAAKGASAGRLCACWCRRSLWERCWSGRACGKNTSIRRFLIFITRASS